MKSATSAQTQLSWSGAATSYTVQRALVGGSFANIATVTGTSYTDTTVDPYNQTIYQVIAGTPGAQASNRVTVGPPPGGLTLAAPAPLVGNMVAPGYGVDDGGDDGLLYYTGHWLRLEPFHHSRLWPVPAEFRWTAGVEKVAVHRSTGRPVDGLRLKSRLSPGKGAKISSMSFSGAPPAGSAVLSSRASSAFSISSSAS